MFKAYNCYTWDLHVYIYVIQYLCDYLIQYVLGNI